MTQIPTWNGGQVSPPNGRAAPGAIIGGRYELRAAVGHGGMGTVWQAADTLLRRDVAVKEVVLPPGLAPSDRDALYERTLREARAAAAIQHPAVVQVYDVVTEGGRPWIVMELLEARSLADMVIEDGPVAPRAVAKIGIALLGALEVAHAIGVLHRDVKPANVLICADGRCVLTDFGVARMPTDVQLTTPGMVLGSPHFISPERAMGQDFGPPSDLFSLGVTLYTAVEGRPPFDKGDPIETMHAVVEDAPAPPVRSGPLTRILFGLLEKDPAQRLNVHTARSMLRELLAGPLASKAPTDQMTDPYAVVPVQRPQWQAPSAPPPPSPQPSGQIGGRAMIAPGQSLTDRLAELRKGEQQEGAENPSLDPAAGASPGAPSPATAAALSIPTGAMPAPSPMAAPAADALDVPTGAMPSSAADPLNVPTGAMPAPNRAAGSADPTERWEQPTGVVSPGPLGSGRVISGQVVTGTGPASHQPGGFPPAGPQPGGLYGGGPAQNGPYPGAVPQGIGFPTGTGTPGGFPTGPNAPGGGFPTGPNAPGGFPPPPGGFYPGTPQPGGFPPVGPVPAGGQPGGGNAALDRTRQAGGQLITTIKGWPRKVQLAVAGGVAVVLLLGLVFMFSGSDPDPTPPPQATSSSAPAGSAPETQAHSDKGVSVNVPKGWTRKSSGGYYVDYTDPEDSGRRVRIIVEPFKGDDPRRWAEIASNVLKGNTKTCARPYAQLAITDQELGGKPAAELEYNCGEGESMRHGIWRGLVTDGKAYSFYLTSGNARFEESKPIFDEMVRSFQLTEAS
ncbi:protein kinase domain-containing protein [Micromonospora sonneratiae]|uniref:non-specific serine/threonine protein kinase n=1 Tax=Micromonospora sonneratiae TaxID=1184706 RepID=A0ABW3YRV2_9ACTN